MGGGLYPPSLTSHLYFPAEAVVPESHGHGHGHGQGKVEIKSDNYPNNFSDPPIHDVNSGNVRLEPGPPGHPDLVII